MKQLERGLRLRVASTFEVSANLLHRLRKEIDKVRGTHSQGRVSDDGKETRVAQLERKTGQQTLEADFLKGCLHREALTGKSAC